MAENRERGKKKLPMDECALFCEQVCLILGAGIPLYDGVEALADSFGDTRSREAFYKLDADVKETGSLYQAMRAADIFPDYMVGMVNIGEQTGKLDAVMRALGAYYEREDKIRHAIRSAVTYPLGLVAMMAVVILILVTRVLPIFERVYANLGSSLSASTNAVIRFGMGAGRAALVAVALVVAVALGVAAFLRTNKREAVLSALVRLVPRARRFGDRLGASRFSSAMSLMLASGYPLEEAVRMLPDVFGGWDARKRVEEMARSLDEGVPFPDALEKTGLFERLHMKMLRVGFLAGQADQVLAKLANIYQEELDDDITRLVGTIEPTMVALLSVVIGAILLSVMLPLAGIMSSIA